MTKKTPDVDVAVCKPPSDWIRMQIAIPPRCWRVYARAAIRMNCEPADVVDHILRVGFEGFQKFEREDLLLEAHDAKQHH